MSHLNFHCQALETINIKLGPACEHLSLKPRRPGLKIDIQTPLNFFLKKQRWLFWETRTSKLLSFVPNSHSFRDHDLANESGSV